MRAWAWQRWGAAALGAVATALVIGIPTGIVKTPVYTRMTPVLWWNVPIWAVTALLTGLIVATYVRRPARPATDVGARTGVGGVLSLFAVGCPICNKLVVALIGVSGALNVWAPIQPVLGIAGLGLLGYALRVRTRGERQCGLSAERTQVAPTP